MVNDSSLLHTVGFFLIQTALLLPNTVFVVSAIFFSFHKHAVAATLQQARVNAEHFLVVTNMSNRIRICGNRMSFCPMSTQLALLNYLIGSPGFPCIVP